MESNVKGCTDLIHKCQSDDTACEKAFDQCNMNLIDPVQMTGIDVYDARQQCKLPPLCGDFSHVKKYLSSPRVQKVLGVSKPWAACNFGINMQFHTDWMKNQAIALKLSSPKALKGLTLTLTLTLGGSYSGSARE